MERLAAGGGGVTVRTGSGAGDRGGALGSAISSRGLGWAAEAEQEVFAVLDSVLIVEG